MWDGLFFIQRTNSSFQSNIFSDIFGAGKALCLIFELKLVDSRFQEFIILDISLSFLLQLLSFGLGLKYWGVFGQIMGDFRDIQVDFY